MTADDVTSSSDYRSYEVYQRERVGDSTNLVNPRDLISDDYLADPFSTPGVLRENYPCYRDWVRNQFWVTRYDDVTSVFTDDANYHTRSQQSIYGKEIIGDDLRHHPLVLEAVAARSDEVASRFAGRPIVDPDVDDLFTGFVRRVQMELVIALLGVPAEQAIPMAMLVAQLRQGTSFVESDRLAGIAAYHQLVAMAETVIERRRAEPTDDLIGAVAAAGGSAQDLAVTMLETDQETLASSLSNLWCLLLQHPEQLHLVVEQPRLMKFAYLESLRHSPAKPTADRFARHEVERFGRLLPQGARLHLSAAAANRDPRQFVSPDTFDITRKDLCQREPRGQYRADGLPAGIVFGYGKPSSLPAVPRDAPRSMYAIARDFVVAASLALIEQCPNVRALPDRPLAMSSLFLGGAYACRSLPVLLD